MSDGILQEWLAFILSICSRDESLQTFMMYRFLEQAKMTEAFFAELKARRQNSNIREFLTSEETNKKYEFLKYTNAKFFNFAPRITVTFC